MVSHRRLRRRECLKDWLETLNTQAESTVTGYRGMAGHMAGLIGTVKLADLKVRDVQFALGKLAERLSTRSVRLARMILIQAIRNAMANDLVVRNVADLANVPAGRPGRPSRSLDLEQALRELVPKQAAGRAKAGTARKESNLVFRTSLGGPMYATDVRMEFKPVTRTAAIALGPLFESKERQTEAKADR